MSQRGARSAGVMPRFYKVGVMTTNSRATAARFAKKWRLPVYVLEGSILTPPIECWRHGDGGWQKEMFL